MALNKADVKVGDSRVLVLVEDLTRTQIVQYAGASGDYNPLHTDDVYARESAGFPGVFAHGMLTMGMTGRIVTDWVGDATLTSYGVRFVGQDWPGDSLTATATVTAVSHDSVEIGIVTQNQRGETVLTGSASAHLG